MQFDQLKRREFITLLGGAAVALAAAPNGEAADIDWADSELAVPYEALPEEGEWLMATGPVRALIERLARDCLRLDDPTLTTAIFQGLITSADYLYHLERLGNGRYVCTPKGNGANSYEVAIEDAIMKPLVSGSEAKRYETPETSTYLLFPYERAAGGSMHLIPADAMKRRFPHAWRHLRKWERELRRRESNSFNDDAWYRFGRHQNIDKQDIVKLIVAQTVPKMRVCADYDAAWHLNNVRVNGILPTSGVDISFLLGVLNGTVADFVFRRIGKPKQGGWYEANKQFIAPLPIPNASSEARAKVARKARTLQARWTHRRDLLREAEARLSVLGRARHPARWLWPVLPDVPEMLERAPRALVVRSDRRAWAEAQLDEMEASRIEALQAILDRCDHWQARFERGELRLFADGAVVADRIFIDNNDGGLAEAYWRYLLLKGPAREAERFAGDLRRPPAATDSPAAAQFVERVATLAKEVAAIEADERAMNDLLYDLYDLSPEERNLVDNERSRRHGAIASG
jgi:hypothetical protein